MRPPHRHRHADTHRDGNENPLVALAEQLGGRFRPGPPLDGWLWARGSWLPVEIKLPEREDDKDVLRTLGARVSA